MEAEHQPTDPVRRRLPRLGVVLRALVLTLILGFINRDVLSRESPIFQVLFLILAFFLLLLFFAGVDFVFSRLRRDPRR